MRAIVILSMLAVIHSWAVSLDARTSSTLEQRRHTLRVGRVLGSLDNGTTPAVAIVFRQGMRKSVRRAETHRVLLAVWPDGQVAWSDGETTEGRYTCRRAQVPVAQLDSVIDRLAARGVFDDDFSAYNFAVPDADSYELVVRHKGRFLHIWMDSSFQADTPPSRFAGDPRAESFHSYVTGVRKELMTLLPANPPAD